MRRTVLRLRGVIAFTIAVPRAFALQKQSLTHDAAIRLSQQCRSALFGSIWLHDMYSFWQVTAPRICRFVP